MDVNLALARLRDAIKAVRREQDGNDEPMTERQLRNVLENMTDYAESLDGWLSKGGFLPTAWEAQR
jgi:hypothetical protein